MPSSPVSRRASMSGVSGRTLRGTSAPWPRRGDPSVPVVTAGRQRNRPPGPAVRQALFRHVGDPACSRPVGDSPHPQRRKLRLGLRERESGEHTGCRDSVWGSWAMTFQGDLGQGEVLFFGVRPVLKPPAAALLSTPQTVPARSACPPNFSRDELLGDTFTGGRCPVWGELPQTPRKPLSSPSEPLRPRPLQPTPPGGRELHEDPAGSRQACAHSAGSVLAKGERRAGALLQPAVGASGPALNLAAAHWAGVLIPWGLITSEERGDVAEGRTPLSGTPSPNPMSPWQDLHTLAFP